MTSNLQLIRTGLWQWLKGTGLERFELLQSPGKWLLRGTILTLAEHEPAEVRYEIVCDSAWLTRGAEILIRHRNEERELHITAEQGN